MGWQEFFNHPIFGNGLVNTPVVGLRPFADLCLGKSAGEDSETVDLGSSGSEQRALPDFGAGTGSLGSLPSDSLNTDIELQFGLNTSARSFFKHEETAPPPAEKPATFGAALWVAKKFWFLARRTDPQLAEVSVRLKLTAFCLAKKVLAVWADPRQLETFALLRRSQSLGCSPLKPRTSLPQDSKLFDSAKDLFEAIRDDLTASVPAEALGSDGEDLLGRGQTGKDLELFLTKMYIYFNGLPTETFRRPLIRQMFRSALNQLRQCVYEKMQGAGTGEADRLAIPTFPDFDKADIYPQTPMVRGPGLEFFGELL